MTGLFIMMLIFVVQILYILSFKKIFAADPCFQISEKTEIFIQTNRFFSLTLFLLVFVNFFHNSLERNLMYDILMVCIFLISFYLSIVYLEKKCTPNNFGQSVQRYRIRLFIMIVPFFIFFYFFHLFFNSLFSFQNLSGQYSAALVVLEGAIFISTSYIYLLFLAPILLKDAFGATPIEDASTLLFLNSLFKKFHVAAPKYCYVTLERTKQKNIFIAGLGGFSGHFQRTLFISKELLADMTCDEFEAVILHEIGHIKQHHLPKRVLWMFTSLLISYLPYIGITYFALIYFPAFPAFLTITFALYLFYRLHKKLIHFQVFNQELDADTHAVFSFKCDLNIFCRTLNKIGFLNDVDIKLSPENQSHLNGYPDLQTRVDTLKARSEYFRRKGKFIPLVWLHELAEKYRTPLTINSFGFGISIFIFLILFFPTISKNLELSDALVTKNYARAHLLLDEGASINFRDFRFWGNSPINRLIEKGDLDGISFALKNGADPSFTSGIYHITPLLSAIDYDRPAVLELLMTNLNLESAEQIKQLAEVAKFMHKTESTKYFEKRIEEATERAIASEGK